MAKFQMISHKLKTEARRSEEVQIDSTKPIICQVSELALSPRRLLHRRPSRLSTRVRKSEIGIVQFEEKMGEVASVTPLAPLLRMRPGCAMSTPIES